MVIKQLIAACIVGCQKALNRGWEAKDVKRVLEAFRNSDICLNVVSHKYSCSQSYPEKTFRWEELFCSGKHSSDGSMEVSPTCGRETS